MIGERIRELRKKNHLTQRQLADKLYIDQTAISYWEQGKTNPDMDNQIKLADIFGVTIDYLLGRSQQPNPAPAGQIKKSPLKQYLEDNKAIIMGFNGEKQDIIELSKDEYEDLKNMLNIIRKKRN